MAARAHPRPAGYAAPSRGGTLTSDGPEPMSPPELGTDSPRVALVRLSSLGDVVRALPVVASLRRRWPEAELTWVLEPAPHEILAGHPMVDRFLVLRRHLGPAAHPELWWRTRDLEFDLVLDVHRYLKAGLVTAMLRAPVKVGYDRGRSAELNWLFTTHRIPPGPRRHVQEEYFEFLRYLDVPVERAWPLPLTAEERRQQRSFFGGLEGEPLGVLLSSSTDAKDWSLDGWVSALEDARRDLGMQPVLVGGRSTREDRRADELRARAGVTIVDGREQDLRRLLWMADGCSVFVGPDSGPLHIAAAAGTPVVGLYGRTDPRRHGPYGPLGRMEDLLVDRFGPREGAEPTDATRAGRMSLITAHEVVERIALARERYGGASSRAGSGEDGGRP